MFHLTWILVLCYVFRSDANVLREEECLNYTVYPVQYDITLFPHIYQDGNSYYDCDMVITVIANAPNVNIIELDSHGLDIKDGSIKVMYGNVDIVNQYRPYEYDERKGKLYIYLNEPLKQYSVSKTQYLIRISFNKRLKPDSDGIFIVPYDGEDGKRYIYTTRLSPNRAKYFFPCFDNAQFEAVFKFKVYILPPHSGTQYTNTSVVISKEQRKYSLKDNYVIIEYMPSPQVALHQLGFHYSQFGSRQVTAKNTNDTLVIWAPVPNLQYYTYVLKFGETIINLIHEYASINRPLVYGPINIVAVPLILNGYEIGSWNLLTNGENRLAYRPEDTSIKQIDRMTFELSQQLCRIWLGNPGEPERTRWKEEWFKEGVATYLAYYFLAQYNFGDISAGQRRPIGFYGLQMKHRAMAVDWHHTTPALVSFNRTLAIDIPSRYKELVTMKTASILWMVENWIGSEKFHQALVNYINSRRGKYISLDDFMVSLDRDTVECLQQFFNGSTASRVLNSWFHQSGYPVVNVQVFRDRTPNAIMLKQRQFSFTNENRHDSNYLIPISYIVQDNQNCFNCYQPRFTIGMQTYTFGENLNGGWIVLNRNASGYYRVNYDEETWRLIAKTLMEDHLAIGELNRAQIVNDIFALYAAGDVNDEIALEVLDYLNKELSYTVWDSAVAGFEFLTTEGTRMTKTLYEEWQNFMRHKISTIYKRLMEVEQRPKTRLFRNRIVEFACALNHKPCWNDMRRMYNNHIEGRQRLNPDFREACYYIRVNEGDQTIVNSNLNHFELEDKLSAEHKMREMSRFLYRIPVGTPRPQPLKRSTTTTTTEVSIVVTAVPPTASSTVKLASILIIALGVIINMAIR
ncbi:aminopeptidase N-like [Epargyreus clarus]|uniref:aminopeptidase N-like n=1 Tax=Epargyreus clarus TaxID=520877 RepID=UPI003C2C9A75